MEIEAYEVPASPSTAEGDFYDGFQVVEKKKKNPKKNKEYYAGTYTAPSASQVNEHYQQFLRKNPKKPCYNGNKCTKVGCMFDHSAEPTVAVTKKKACLYGKHCNKQYCLFDHSGDAVFPCDYGWRCHRENCFFLHPEGREIDTYEKCEACDKKKKTLVLVGDHLICEKCSSEIEEVAIIAESENEEPQLCSTILGDGEPCNGICIAGNVCEDCESCVLDA